MTKSERESEPRALGVCISLGCKHKMAISNHHQEVFICLWSEKVHECCVRV